MEEINFEKLSAPRLGEQLCCPTDDAGSDFGKLMFESNKGMIHASIKALRLKDRKRLLEIGPGNGEHVKQILEQAAELRYFGLEISETMLQEARAINTPFINKRKALFCKYDGCTVPYVNHFFDSILTINTIYFWENHKDFLAELYRVLKPGGTCIITFVDSESMKNLAFVTDSFALFDIAKIKALVLETPFELGFFQKKSERVKSKNGVMVEREYVMAILKKEHKF